MNIRKRIKHIKSAFSFGNNTPPNGQVPSVVTIDAFTSQLLLSSSYGDLAKAGYIDNVIASTCVRRIADAAKTLPFDVLIDGESIKDSKDRLASQIRELIANPNPNDSWMFLVESAITQRYIAGRSYIYPAFSEIHTGIPLSMEVFRPDRVSITQSQEEEVFRYMYTKGNRLQEFTRDEMGFFDLIDWRKFHPLSDTEGLSYFNPSALSIDGHTAGSKWNKQILENSGKPSMIVSLADNEDSASLSPEQLEEMKESLRRALNEKRGGPAILNFPASITMASLNALEMDFINGIKMKAIEICNGLDFPPYLLGLDGATFNNQAEARMALYEDTTIPKTKELYDLLGSFFSRKTGKDIKFKIKINEITALAGRFKQMHDVILSDFTGNLITRNEARDAIGYEELDSLDGDIFNSDLTAPSFPNIEG